MNSLDVIMPIPSRTLGRGHPWPTAARAFIYEGVERATEIARVVGKSYRTVQTVRRQDKWREFRETASARDTAQRHGLSLPFMLREQSMQGEIEQESDTRASRAAAIRAELTAALSALTSTADKGSQRYTRLVSSVGALQQQLDLLLGLDVAKRVGTAAAIARNGAAIRAKKVWPGFQRGVNPRTGLPAASAAVLVEPDVQIIMP